MLGLGDLLGRIKTSLDRDAGLREAVSDSIRELLGFEIRLADISFKGRTLQVKTTPAKRSELALHEARLLSLIRTKTGLHIDRISY